MQRRLWGIVGVAALIAASMGGTAAAKETAAPPAKATGVAALAISIAETDDNIPGVPLPASPFTRTLTNIDDVYAIYLMEGDRIIVSIAPGPGAVPDQDLDLYLYGPGDTDIDTDDWWDSDDTNLDYTAELSGRYYVDVYNSLWEAPAGDYILTWKVQRSVHRFYNAALGTHFYSASESEIWSVIDNLSHIYQYEGVAYRLNPLANTTTLHRFYKPSTGTHFYTASVTEMNNVRANLSHIYTYEGPAYNVSTSAVGGKPTVHRFYHLGNGTHFYTASTVELNTVRATLSHIYQYEGPAFYLGQ